MNKCFGNHDIHLYKAANSKTSKDVKRNHRVSVYLFGMILAVFLCTIPGTFTAIALEPVASVLSDGSAEHDLSLPLSGLVVCIDPGHQRKGISMKEPAAPGSKVRKAMDSGGTRGVVTKTPESELTLSVGLLLRNELEKRGATVVMTRETQGSRIGNVARAKIANSAKASLCLRIHADGSINPKMAGVSILVPGRQSSCTKSVRESSADAGKSLQESIRVMLKPKRNILVERSDLTGFNWSKVPVVLVEMGFMTNPAEDRKMSGKDWRSKMSVTLADGVQAFLTKEEK